LPVRRKEFSLKSLYAKRHSLLDRLPDFWPTVFGNGPEEVQQFLSSSDLPLISSLKSFAVERYQIESETTGEPRSVRFTFEFAENEFFEDNKLVKEFEYRPREDGPGSLISKPVPIKWKGKKKDVTNGLLDAAVELHAAEQALRLEGGNKEIDLVERESLWQHEKLREKLATLEESPEYEPSFFNWFGFRGAINAQESTPPAENGANGGEEEEDEVNHMLEVEIFPAGEEVAIALAEELWTDAMDYFMSAQDESAFDGDGFEIIDEEGSEDDDAPELVAVEDARPNKRQRKN